MNIKFMRWATLMAKKSLSRYQLGAVVVKDGTAVGVGFNWMGKSHPIMKEFDVCRDERILGLHAEIHACLKVDKKDLKGAEIYVARLKKDGTHGMAMPCTVCQKFLKSRGVAKVIFTTGDYFSKLAEMEIK